jgi:hypothetical protein
MRLAIVSMARDARREDQNQFDTKWSKVFAVQSQWALLSIYITWTCTRRIQSRSDTMWYGAINLESVSISLNYKHKLPITSHILGIWNYRANMSNMKYVQFDRRNDRSQCMACYVSAAALRFPFLCNLIKSDSSIIVTSCMFWPKVAWHVAMCDTRRLNLQDLWVMHVPEK